MPKVRIRFFYTRKMAYPFWRILWPRWLDGWRGSPHNGWRQYDLGGLRLGFKYFSWQLEIKR